MHYSAGARRVHGSVRGALRVQCGFARTWAWRVEGALPFVEYATDVRLSPSTPSNFAASSRVSPMPTTSPFAVR
jgi:hypothetical protein